MTRKVFGVGIYDGTCGTVGNHIYKTWKRMLQRCYSQTFQTKYPSYRGCSVCEEWLTFSNFKCWMESTVYEGLQLDKDLSDFGNKEYRPEKCAFIPAQINSLLQDCGSRRGSLPIGVYRAKGNLQKPYRARVSNLNKGVLSLGYFRTSEEAHAAWKAGKVQVILKALDWWVSDPCVSHSFNLKVVKSLTTFAENELGFKKELVNVV